ncbi:hypothetical protein [Catelliglobosispora koreensis]|uniref:hypothetical protein n=1 Tax=Catelliglobosispora koreensis TaxID=129052 RepID=UPI0012FC9955|nr:hypothetical protein [Catelliglobosispora koreensis]
MTGTAPVTCSWQFEDDVPAALSNVPDDGIVGQTNTWLSVQGRVRAVNRLAEIVGADDRLTARTKNGPCHCLREILRCSDRERVVTVVHRTLKAGAAVLDGCPRSLVKASWAREVEIHRQII